MILMNLEQFFRTGRILVLSGAGISTESGIPDYRGPNGVLRNRLPIKYQEFAGSSEARRRYWARSAAGWHRIGNAEPNDGHRALAGLEKAGFISGIITQNVDRLHHRAGSSVVLELHGALAEAVCMQCGELEARDRLQERILALNHTWEARRFRIKPDGDAEIPEQVIKDFIVPACLSCGGVLKPNVVFFGEDVPRNRVERAWKMLEDADALLVAGSSLTVYSGYRFAERAARDRKRIAILNQGVTRADHLADIRIDAPLGQLLSAIEKRLTSSDFHYRNIHTRVDAPSGDHR